MSNQITQDELNELSPITLIEFNPDYSEEAKFNFTFKDQVSDLSVKFSNDRRVYDFADLHAAHRLIALEAMDLLIDNLFNEQCVFVGSESQTTIYYALHSMCMNYALYSSEGRKLISFEETTN